MAEDGDVRFYPHLRRDRLVVSKYRCDEWCPVWPEVGDLSLWPCSIYPAMYEGGVRAYDLVAFMDVTPPAGPKPRRVSAIGQLTGNLVFVAESEPWINCDGDEVEGPRNRWWYEWTTLGVGDARLPGGLDVRHGPVRHGPESWGGQNAPTVPVPRPVTTWRAIVKQFENGGHDDA